MNPYDQFDASVATANPYDQFDEIAPTGRKIVRNPDGSVSTELTSTVGINGKYYNVPTLFGGKRVSPQDATSRIVSNGMVDPETGRRVEPFSSIDEAVAAAKQRSSDLGKQTSLNPYDQFDKTPAEAPGSPQAAPADKQPQGSAFLAKLRGYGVDTQPPEESYDPSKVPDWMRKSATAVVTTAKGLVPRSAEAVGGLLTPVVGAARDIKNTYGMVKDWLNGAPMDEAVKQNLPDSQILAEAEKTPLGSQERYNAAAWMLAQFGMAAGITKSLSPKTAEIRSTLGIPDAEQNLKTTQPNGVRPEPQVPSQTQEPASSIGSERVPPSGQGASVPSVPLPTEKGVSQRFQPPEGSEVPDASRSTASLTMQALDWRNNLVNEGNNLGKQSNILKAMGMPTPKPLADRIGEINAELQRGFQPQVQPTYELREPAEPVQHGEFSKEGYAATQPVPQAVDTRGAPVEDVGTGISQARTEAELGAGSVEPGVGAELGSGLEYGRNYINNGGDPRLPIRRALSSGLVGKNEVGTVHAELERLRGIRNAASDAAAANPGDPVAQAALDAADTAQRAWRKELQPVLTKASDALREAYAESNIKPDVGTYQGLSDLMDDHFNGKRDVTPQDRTRLQKVAKGVQEVRSDTASAVDRAAGDVARRARRIMTPDELKTDLAEALKGEFADCVL